MKNNYHYNKKLKPLAKANRVTMTKSEACLWKFVLSRGQMNGYQFKRQRPIQNFIVDFVCLPLKLVIEVDGSTHDDEIIEANDRKRDETLKELGFTTLRVSPWEVLNRIDDVAILILKWIDENACCPPPSPRQRGIKRRISVEKKEL